MNIVDANVLLYAVNQSAEHHDEARTWLDASLNGDTAVGFSWIALLAFVRLSTKVGVFPEPLAVDDAVEQIDLWLAQPPSVVVEPTPRHVALLAGLLGPIGAGGNLVNDAHLAALALEHGASIVSYDSDFDRFTGVSWGRPRSPA